RTANPPPELGNDSPRLRFGLTHCFSFDSLLGRTWLVVFRVRFNSLSKALMTPRIAKLALEDGTVFTGSAFGAAGESFGEVVFNTSMTGYQEVLTDPSYKGQIVAMTYPQIGNYGISGEDQESRKVQVEGFIIRELTHIPSSYRSRKSLDEYLAENGIIGLEGI